MGVWGDMVESGLKNQYRIQSTHKDYAMSTHKHDILPTWILIPHRREIFSSIVGGMGVQHISFDKWIMIGVVLTYLEYIHRIDDTVQEAYLSFRDMWRLIYAGRKWGKEVSEKTRHNWLDYCNAVMGELKYTSIDGIHGILANEVVEKYDKYAGVWRPDGIKLNLRDIWIWERVRQKYQWVYLHDYEICCKGMFGDKVIGDMQFVNIFVKYYIAVNNYIGGNHTLTKKTLYFVFKGGRLEDMSISVKYIDRIFESAQRGVLDQLKGKPARIDTHVRQGTSKWVWTIPVNVKREDIVIKIEGRNEKITNDMVICDEVKEAGEKLHEINVENRKHIFEYRGQKVNPFMQGIFQGKRRNDGVVEMIKESYGRNYTRRNGIQALNTEERLEMTIDGNAVCEVDYKSLHPHILYAMEGIQFQGDIYALSDEFLRKSGLDGKTARKACKKMLLILINAKSKDKAMRAFKREWNENNQRKTDAYIAWLTDLYDEIVRKHDKIKGYFATGVGIKLQYMDGMLMREICYRLSQEGIGIGAVHDSVIVDRQYRDKVEKVMHDEYVKRFGGMDCPTDVKER